MEAASLALIKKELKHSSHEEVVEMCLRLARFKKDNKELLSYLIYEQDHEDRYIESVKEEMDNRFADINTSSVRYIKRSCMSIMTRVRKCIRYSGRKTTEVELLMYYLEKMKAIRPRYSNSRVLTNLFERTLVKIHSSIQKLEDDLRHDYLMELEERLG